MQPHPSPAAETLRLLAEQHQLLEAVGRLCSAQARLIDEGESEELLAVIEQRGLILNQAAELGARIDQGTASIPPSDPALPTINQRRAAVAELARAIARSDAADTKRLGAKRDELAATLASMNTNRAATGAYSGSRSAPGPGFQDTSA
jgi:hypothetical protein